MSGRLEPVQNGKSNAKSLALAWVNFSFEAKPNPMADPKRILKNINGYLDFGTMTALMGPSGCGKSTLLKCVNGRNVGGITRDSRIFVSKQKKLTSCFIVQDVEEHLMYGLTGCESLLYASRIKNNTGKNGKVNHMKNVKKLMVDLMITETERTLVEKCSGGEQKRLAIAMELTSVKKPSVLCIDEPTSGLDSNAAEIVMKCLQKAAVTHQIAVITSIHQPNSDVLMLFDKIYVLVAGGRVVFFGQPSNLRHQLSDVGIDCHYWQVPIEVMMNLATEGLKDERVKRLIQITDAETGEQLDLKCKREGILSHGIEIKTKSFKFLDLWYLILRNITCIVRSEWKGMLFQIVLLTGFGFILSQQYSRDVGKVVGCLDPTAEQVNGTCKRGIEGVIEMKIIAQNLMFLFFGPAALLFLILFGTALTFSTQLKLFQNELYNGWYSSTAYYWSKMVVEMPLVTVIAVLFALIVFYGSEQYEEDFRVLMCIYTYVMAVLTAQGFGFFLGITVGQIHPQLTLVVVVAVYELYMALCNFLIPLDHLPDFINDYVSQISFLKHAYFNLIILAYGFDRCPDGYVSRPMQKFDIEDDNLWWFSGAMLVHFGVYRVLGWICIVLISKPPRSKKVKGKRTVIKVKPLDLESIDVNMDQMDDGPKRRYSKWSIQFPNKKNSYAQTEFEYKKGKRGLELAMAWINLTFIGQTFHCLRRRPKTILRELNGRVDFGSLTALMGPSGSGKSTLLKCINGQNNKGLSGDSQVMVSQNKPIRSCFIVQDQKEHLLPGLTGEETLLYASRLKNNGVEDADEEVDVEMGFEVDHKRNIKKLLSDLKIKNTSSTVVQKCSGGEQKRLTIAMEMTGFVKPNVICIDEPTSGLDSNAAELVVKNLKSIAKQNQMAIVTSIHQPNADVLMMFDQVYVLAKGGVCVYAGPPQDIRKHLTSCGIKCEDWQVPIEILLKVASQPGSEQLRKLAQKTYKDNHQNIVEKSQLEGIPTSDGMETRSNKSFSFADVWFLLIRSTIYNLRCNWIVYVGQFIINVLLGVVLTLLYNENMAKYDGCLNLAASVNESCSLSPEKIQEEEMLAQNLSFVFFTSSLLNFIQMAATIFTFPSEVKIFLNEYRNGWYSSGSYYLAKTIVEFPIPIVINGSCAAMLYLLSQQIRETNRFLGVCIMFVMETMTTQGMAFMFGLLFVRNLLTAIMSAVGFFIITMLFCGFVAPVNEMNDLVQDLSNLSYMKHFFSAAMVWIYGRDRCESPLISSILFRYGFNDDMVWKNAIYLTLHFANFRVIAFLILFVKAKFNI